MLLKDQSQNITSKKYPSSSVTTFFIKLCESFTTSMHISSIAQTYYSLLSLQGGTEMLSTQSAARLWLGSIENADSDKKVDTHAAKTKGALHSPQCTL